MLLHHIATCALVGGSALSNFIGIGCLVNYLHLFTDIFASSTKFFGCSKYDTFAGVYFILTIMPAWLHFRLLCFPWIIYKIASSPVTVFVEPELTKYNYYMQLHVVYLGTLALLHFYWYSLFIRMIYTFATKGKAEDI